MTLFVVVINDRHRDPFTRVFTDPSVAIGWAERTFRTCLAHPSGYVEHGPDGTRLWFAGYEYEADHAWVEEVELDDGSDA